MEAKVYKTPLKSYIQSVMKMITKYSTVVTGLAVVLLVVLAGMQYQWLTEISRTQKNRLENQMQSGAKSFSTEFNNLFSEVGSAIDLLGDETGMKEQLESDYHSWLEQAEYPKILEKVYLIPPEKVQAEGALAYDAEQKLFTELDHSELDNLKTSWKFNRKKEHVKKGQMLFLGRESMIIKRAPQTRSYFDEFIDLMSSKEDLRSYLSDELKSSYIVLKLSNEVIQENILLGFYESFFGSDYRNQFNFVVRDNSTNHIYHQLHDNSDSQNNPEVVQRLGDLELQNFIILFADKSEKKESSYKSSEGLKQVLDTTLEKVSRIAVNSLKFSFSTDSGSEKITTESLNKWTEDSLESIQVGKKNGDTPSIKTATSSANSGLSLQVFMRQGDLETYIAKTKWKNMGLSLSILIILGIAFGLVSYNAKASQKLADQQMMFVAGISHELKTPISVINSAAENLQDGLIRKPQKMEEYGKLIHKEGNRLKGMVNQVMQLAELQSDQMVLHKQKIQPHELVDQTKIQMKALLDEAEISLAYYDESGDLSLNADHEMMIQVLANLISNAIKYRGEDNRIVIRTRKRADTIEISIRDFGVGIPEHEQEHIFEPFYRGSIARKQQIQGNGLGLYITHQLVRRHNGEITVESVPGKGTTFTIHLPAEDHE